MFDREPGPLSRIEDDQIAPFPARRSFEGLVADAIGDFPALDAVLAGAAIATTDAPPVDLDAVFASTIGGARDVIVNQIAGAPTSPASQLVSAGDNAGGIRQDVLRYLPQPDAPIIATLEDPPQPPGPIAGGTYISGNLPHDNPN